MRKTSQRRRRRSTVPRGGAISRSPRTSPSVSWLANAIAMRANWRRTAGLIRPTEPKSMNPIVPSDSMNRLPA